MSDPHPHRAPRNAPSHADKRTLFERLLEFLSPGPDSRDELIETLADAELREVIEPESRLMLEGVIRMADMRAGDVLVAAPRMDLLDIDAPYDELLQVVIATGHSRFPVYEGERDKVIGILMAKDLLKLQRAPELNLRTLLRPAVFVPESKRLNELLRDFRSNRNHLAMVIDEFGQTAGLITIEDVLEEIVGEIEDEFDEKDGDNSVYTLADGSHRV
ncbi:MAG: CBS domain-containing protein, partial [Burkholderiaceae bacterium]